jgi:hypothetical protein
MSNPTSSFGWQMPTASDLVTDLPADFETFGQAVDTTLADLKGGTTGQVLSKASNTDMDFTWVTSDDANAIQNAIVDAKGDLIAASAADTPARLAVGNNGETLVADSSTSTGLRYTAGTVQANPVLNSAFQIAQRGTSFTVNNAQQYVLDRWYAYTFNNATYSRQATGDTTNLPFIQYCMRVARNSGATSTANLVTHQSMETINSIPFAGKTVTMSFYARKGANYSEANSQVTVYLVSGTGTDQNYSAGYTGAAYPINNQKATLTTTWQRFSFTGTIAATATELAPYFETTPVGTAGAADYFEITGVQIDVGSVALPFRTYAGTIQGELSACQRYYWRTTGGYGNYAGYGMGSGTSTTQAEILLPFPVSMRTNPSIIEFSQVAVTDTANLSAVTGITLSYSNVNAAMIYPTVASGLTQYRPYKLVNNFNSTTAYVGISAEL